MRRYWNSLFRRDDQRSIWVEQGDLGKEKVLKLKNKRYTVKIPQNINKKVILRLRGLGKIKGNQIGDLYLSIWLNKGDDIYKNLWLSETSARNGTDKTLRLDEKKITVVIPPNSHDGLTIRLKGLGRELDFSWRAPFLHRKRGNLLVKLFVFPDSISPKYGSFEMLGTEDMALEGWVYQKVDEVIRKIGNSSFPAAPIQAGAVADQFNEHGWRGVFRALVGHLKLTHVNIELAKSDPNSLPGKCQRTITYQNSTPVACKYLITINEKFLDNPFSVAAILAHELCHVIHYERIDEGSKVAGYRLKAEPDKLEEERTVDLLVFMFKIGEFQLRVSRDKRLTLGYFHQDIFERMQVIVLRKLNA